MISVCYLSSTRRRRARSRWCWAPAPGGCWMWLGREQKTTKTTAWCTAKVSKQLLSLQHAKPQSSPFSCLSVFLFCFLFSFSCSSHFSKSQAFTSNCCYARKDTERYAYCIFFFLIQRLIYITQTLMKLTFFRFHHVINTFLSLLY